jgi:hypothetical protein
MLLENHRNARLELLFQICLKSEINGRKHFSNEKGNRHMAIDEKVNAKAIAHAFEIGQIVRDRSDDLASILLNFAMHTMDVTPCQTAQTSKAYE